MGKHSAIEWTHHTWNPWVGCHKVSAACENCYMYREANRYGSDPTVVRVTKPQTFYAPLHWRGPARVFACSWSDFFIEEADRWRPDAWDVIRATPHLTYLILTKRPENIPSGLPPDWYVSTGRDSFTIGYPNVKLGVTVESQEYAGRIQELQKVVAAGYFVSVEPMLGPLDLRPVWWDWPLHYEPPADKFAFWDVGYRLQGVDWVICACESMAGKRAGRPTSDDDVRFLLRQCQGAGVPFFLKQLTGPDGKLVSMPEFDGRVWDEVPEGWGT